MNDTITLKKKTFPQKYPLFCQTNPLLNKYVVKIIPSVISHRLTDANKWS